MVFALGNMKRKLLFVPAGGLGNRMRSIASAVSLTRKAGVELEIIWFCDWALNACFCKLFKPFVLPDNVVLRDAAWKDYILFGRPRMKNLGIPRLFQKLLFDSCLYERNITPLRDCKFDFPGWVSGGRVYMASYTEFYPFEDDLLRELFRPVDKIEEKIKRRCDNFSGYTVGVHIRRTDHAASIENSPMSAFYEYLDAERSSCKDLRIFLATDSEEVKSQMRKRYGNILLCSENVADRGTVSGIQDGIIDMYTLSHTRKVYGSFQSSFSDLAARLGNIPLTIVQKGRDL